MTKREILASLFLFSGCDFDALDAKYGICSGSTEKTYGDDKTILCAGSGSGLPAISNGHAVIVAGDGSRCAVLRYLSEGDSFGAASLFSGGEHRTFVKSSGGCTVVTLPRKILCRLLREVPDCSMAYISFLSERIAFLNRKITAFTAGSAEAKLAVYLSGLPIGRDGKASVDVSYSSLADMLGISRASLYRALDSLENAGLIARKNKDLTIPNIKALCDYAL